jgi:hypothetical protein
VGRKKDESEMKKSKNLAARKHTESVNTRTPLKVRPEWALEKLWTPQDNSPQAVIQHALEHITTCAICRAPSTGAAAIYVQDHIPMPLPVLDDDMESGCLYLITLWKDGVTTGGLAFLGRCAACRILLTEMEVAQRIGRYIGRSVGGWLDAND